MFDMIGVAPICVRADREVQSSICKRLTSGPIEVLDKIFPPILGRGKSGLNRAKNPVVWARHKGQNKGRSKFVLDHNVGLSLPAVKKFSEIITIVLLNLFMYNYSKKNFNVIQKMSSAWVNCTIIELWLHTWNLGGENTVKLQMAWNLKA